MSDATQNAAEDLHIYTRLESRALNILKIERVCVSKQLNVSGYFMLSPSLFYPTQYHVTSNIRRTFFRCWKIEVRLNFECVLDSK
jgi:hypothetical protein